MYYKPCQKSMAGEATGPRGLPATLIWINGYVFKLPYEYVCLYPQTTAAVSIGLYAKKLMQIFRTGKNVVSK